DETYPQPGAQPFSGMDARWTTPRVHVRKRRRRTLRDVVHTGEWLRRASTSVRGQRAAHTVLAFAGWAAFGVHSSIQSFGALAPAARFNRSGPPKGGPGGAVPEGPDGLCGPGLLARRALACVYIPRIRNRPRLCAAVSLRAIERQVADFAGAGPIPCMAAKRPAAVFL